MSVSDLIGKSTCGMGWECGTIMVMNKQTFAIILISKISSKGGK